MEGSAFTRKGFLRNLFGWRGRLSRSGYWTLWLIVRFINYVLIRFFAIIADYSHHGILDVFFLLICLLWYIATYFVLLFAAMRRYHDSGNPGWQALIFDGFGRLCVIGSVGWLGFFFLLSGIGNVFPDDDEKFLRVLGGGFLVFAVGFILCIVNLLFLIRKSEPEENEYDKPPLTKKQNFGDIY